MAGVPAAGLGPLRSPRLVHHGDRVELRPWREPLFLSRIIAAHRFRRHSAGETVVCRHHWGGTWIRNTERSVGRPKFSIAPNGCRRCRLMAGPFEDPVHEPPDGSVRPIGLCEDRRGDPRDSPCARLEVMHLLGADKLGRDTGPGEAPMRTDPRAEGQQAIPRRSESGVPPCRLQHASNPSMLWKFLRRTDDDVLTSAPCSDFDPTEPVHAHRDDSQPTPSGAGVLRRSYQRLFGVTSDFVTPAKHFVATVDCLPPSALSPPKRKSRPTGRLLAKVERAFRAATSAACPSRMDCG